MPTPEGFFAAKCRLQRKFKRHLETKVVIFSLIQPIIIVHIIGPSIHPVMLHQALSSCHVVSKQVLWEIFLMGILLNSLYRSIKDKVTCISEIKNTLFIALMTNVIWLMMTSLFILTFQIIPTSML